jgi:photosystem II stability/assembly factor-like uncharacterized protein
MMLKRCVATLAAMAGCAFGVAAPAAAAAPAPGTTQAIPRGLVPTSTSWTSPQSGIVLAYTSLNAGARPYLFLTGNGGRTWRPLPAPPVPFPVVVNEPVATWAGGVIAVTDGTHIVVTRDSGGHWSAVRLAGASGAFIDKLVIANGRVFALAQKQSGGTGSETVYSGPAQSGVLGPVRGLTVRGSIVYGDITATGVLQVDLGADFAAQRYWYSRDGVHFVSAPRACPATTTALLGGERAGQVIALCNGDASDPGPGVNRKQVWIAARLGGGFRPSGPVFISANEQRFAAASAQDMTVATTFTLSVTFNAGRTWADAITEPPGAFWTDLSFQSATTGVAVATTVNNAGQLVGFVYRTTDAGHTWHTLSLP